MTAASLIAQLKKFPPNTIVIVWNSREELVIASDATLESVITTPLPHGQEFITLGKTPIRDDEISEQRLLVS